MAVGRNPRARRRATVRFDALAKDQLPELVVQPNPARLDRWSASGRGIDSEESGLRAIAAALLSAQLRAISAPEFALAYDLLADLSQKEHARLSGFRQADMLSKQQHVIVSCPAFDARLSWFWYDEFERRKAEALTRCLLSDMSGSDSEIARCAAERIGAPGAAGGIRKVVGAGRRLVEGRRALRALVTHLPELTVDDVKREFAIDGRGDFLVMPLLMMSWRGEL